MASRGALYRAKNRNVYIYIWGNTFVELVISWFDTIHEIYENWKTRNNN